MHVPIFLVLLFCGIIIALLNFTSFVKILCNFGTSGKEIRQKEMDKSSYKIPLPEEPIPLRRSTRGGLEDVKQQKVRSNI